MIDLERYGRTEGLSAEELAGRLKHALSELAELRAKRGESTVATTSGVATIYLPSPGSSARPYEVPVCRGDSAAMIGEMLLAGQSGFVGVSRPKRDAEFARLEDERDKARKERNAYLANLTATQARCTTLLDEVRARRCFAAGSHGQLRALHHVVHERNLQDRRWGAVHDLLDVPFGTGPDWTAFLAQVREDVEEHQAETGSPTCCWAHVLLEETAEVLAESDPKALRNELTQTGAVCIKAIEIIDDRDERAKGKTP